MNYKKKKRDYQINRKPWGSEICSNCGNDHFVQGMVRTHARLFKFRALNSGMFNYGKEIIAGQCTRCGKIELFAEQAV